MVTGTSKDIVQWKSVEIRTSQGDEQDLDLQGLRFGEPGRRYQESQQLYKFMKKATFAHRAI